MTKNRNTRRDEIISSFLKALPLPAYFLSNDKQFFCNNEFALLIGEKESAELNRDMAFPKSLLLKLKRMEEELISQTDDSRIELRVHIKHRPSNPFMLREKYIRFDAINCSGFIGLMENIFDQVAIENHFSESEKHLKKLISTKDKFFSILAHDLKNPFSVLLGLTNLMMNSYDSLTKEELLESLTKLNHSSKHVYELFDNLLEWSRLQRGIMEYYPTEFNLRAAAQSGFFALSLNLSEKGLTYENNIDEEIEVFADEHMIETVFRNLIGNSIKFTKRGGHISVYTKKATKKEIIVAVEDTGIGMDKETLGNN